MFNMNWISATLIAFGIGLFATLSSPADAAGEFSVDQAPHFEHKKLKISGQNLDVEIADNQDRWAYGLMNRLALKEGTGMLFVFPQEKTRSFWMKNTFVALAIGYFNQRKELIDIQEMAPAQSEMQTDLPNYVSSEPAQYALEVPKGWFQKHKVHLKTRFVLQ